MTSQLDWRRTMGVVIASWQVAATMSSTNTVLVKVQQVESMVVVLIQYVRRFESMCLVVSVQLSLD